MQLESLTLAALAADLRQRAIGARLRRVREAPAGALVLDLRGSTETLELFVRLTPGFAHLRLGRDLPAERAKSGLPLMMRQRLEGARLQEVFWPAGERLLALRWAGRDAFGEPLVLALWLELFGARPRAVLCDDQNVLLGVHPSRALRAAEYVGGTYAPPLRTSLSPFAASPEAFLARLTALAASDLSVGAAFAQFCPQLGPVLPRELCARAGGSLDRLLGPWLLNGLRWLQEISAVPADEARVLTIDGRRVVWPQPSLAFEEVAQGELNAMLEATFEAGWLAERQETQRRVWEKQQDQRRLRLLKKLDAQRQELAIATGAEDLLRVGQAILAHLHEFSEEGRTLHLPELGRSLDLPPGVRPQQLAQEYFSRYKKARRAQSVLEEEIARGEAALRALEQEPMDPQSSDEPRLPLRELQDPLAPLTVQTTHGAKIWVGRNRKGNDHLTFHLARPEDIWLHVRDAQGSHVILRQAQRREPHPLDLQRAAELAAYFSKRRNDGHVAVDYTPRKHVKKPSGAAAGFVIYERFSTLLVDPKGPSSMEGD